VAGIRSGDQAFVQGGAATPTALLTALEGRAVELRDVGIVHFHTEGPARHLAPEMAAHFRHRALFIGANARQAVNEGRADYVPVFLSDMPERRGPNGPWKRSLRPCRSRRAGTNLAVMSSRQPAPYPGIPVVMDGSEAIALRPPPVDRSRPRPGSPRPGPTTTGGS
jgi:hypothetical protein